MRDGIIRMPPNSSHPNKIMTSHHLERITRVENPIGSGKNNWLAHLHWRSVPLDSLIFDRPSHDGSPLDIARQVYHRLLARMVAARVHVWQTWLIMGAFALGFHAGSLSGSIRGVRFGGGGPRYNPSP